MFVPQFLYVSVSAWIFFFLLFLAFYEYLSRRVPDSKILEYEPKTIRVKKRLGIKIYKF